MLKTTKGPLGPFLGGCDPGFNCHPGPDPGSIFGVFATGIAQRGYRIESGMTLGKDLSG